MASKPPISNSEATYRVNKKIRRDWNGLSPVCRVIPNKKKNPKIKHKNKIKEEYE